MFLTININLLILFELKWTPSLPTALAAAETCSYAATSYQMVTTLVTFRTAVAKITNTGSPLYLFWGLIKMSLYMRIFTNIKGIISTKKKTLRGHNVWEDMFIFVRGFTLPLCLHGAINKSFKWRVCVCLWAIVHLPPFRCSDWLLTHPPTAPSILLTPAPASSQALLCLYGHQASLELQKSDLYNSLDLFGEEAWANRCYSGSRGPKGKRGDTSEQAQVLSGWSRPLVLPPGSQERL